MRCGVVVWWCGAVWWCSVVRLGGSGVLWCAVAVLLVSLCTPHYAPHGMLHMSRHAPHYTILRTPHTTNTYLLNLLQKVPPVAMASSGSPLPVLVL